MICPTELRRRYHEGRLIPFVGAGISMSISWDKDGKPLSGPSWAELVDEATKLLGFEDPNLARVRGTDLQILEYFKQINTGNTAHLKNWLTRRMDPPDLVFQNSIIYKNLVELKLTNLFYTTNFDNFLERAFSVWGRAHKTLAVESDMGIPGDNCEIIKFHGDLDHPDQIVLTESDYEKRLSLTTAMDFRLKADLLGRVILFLGYSFRDPNVSYLFRLFTNDFYDQPNSLSGYRAYIVVADPSDFEYELFQARKIQVIPVNRATITEDICSLLEEMRG